MARCFVGDHTVSLHPISSSDVDKVIAASDLGGYPVIVVGEKNLAIHHLTPILEEIFVKGLGVESLDFHTDVADLAGEEILQLTSFCNAEQEAVLMQTLDNCTSGRWHPAFTDITARDADKERDFMPWLSIWAWTSLRRWLSGMEATT